MQHRPRRSVLLALLLSSPLAAQTLPQTAFFPLTPCRAVDTRNASGAFGGPALSAGTSRTFTLVGACGIPPTARSVNLNIVAVTPQSAGFLSIFPGGSAAGNASAISYGAGQVRANNFIARLGTNGDIVVFCQQPAGTTHFIIDVSGYFEDPPPAPPSQLAALAGITTFGSTPSLVAHMRDVGTSAFVDEQLAQPPSIFAPMALFPNNVPAACTSTCPRENYTMYPLQKEFFFAALYLPNQLRQRVVWALHKVIPINGQDIGQPSRMVPYLNIFMNGAFGNYRDILGQITLNPAMGQYLNMRTSTLSNPNENYAREILQLFSIGLVKLNPDGTPQLDASLNPIPTYDQATITEFARVFTGWRFASQPVAGTDNYLDPMVLVPANHDQGGKTLLNGQVLPAFQTGDKDLSDALDNIFNHPNVGPFIGGALIRNLVTSNPSPGYVGRVAAKFNDDGLGVRGNLAAVVRAIVTDPEALAGAANPDFGILREPALFAISLLRGLGAFSASGTGPSDGVLAPQIANLGETVFQPDTVFSYFPADYLTPGTSLLGPEFGILSASTALRRANLVNTLVFSTIPVGANNPFGTSLDLGGIQTLSNTPDLMVEELNQRLCHGLLSAGAKAAVVTAVNAVPATNPRLRAQQATYLVATSSQFQVGR